MTALVTVLVVFAIAIFAIILLIQKFTYVCPPNEVLIFSGAKREFGGRKLGYRLIQGGRGFKIPMLERVDRMDLTNMIIDIRVKGAFSKEGIPLTVEGVANVKIWSQVPTIDNAIERLLGKKRVEVISIARETLEGNLRGVLSTLTPEEVNQDREKFAVSLTAEADQDLMRLGLKLDTLKIQNVSDDAGYLDSLGRQQTADLLMRSRIAEAENEALAAERAAGNEQTQEIAKIEAEIATARAEAERRIVDAQTKKLAMVAEEKSRVVSAVARATAEVRVQHARLEQVRLQLDADKIKPAEAKKQQMIEIARGHSSKIIEEGKATAEALRRVGDTWRESGISARQVMVAQKLAPLVRHLMSTVKDMPIDKVTVIDKELATGGGNMAVNAAITSEQLKHTVGLDLPQLIRQVARQNDA